jgi:hypothetical protein
MPSKVFYEISRIFGSGMPQAGLSCEGNNKEHGH